MDVAQRKQFPADAIELSGDFKFAQMIGERDAGAIASGTGLFGVIYRIAKFERSSSRFTIRSAFVPATLVDGKFSERIGELSRRSVVLPANESTVSGRLASEDQIIASVLAGQTNEFRLLVDQYRQPVFRFARNLIGDEHDAEDITQDVFLAAFDHLNSYNANRAPLRTWLFTITRNRCVNYLKRKRPLVDGNVVVNVTNGCEQRCVGT